MSQIKVLDEAFFGVPDIRIRLAIGKDKNNIDDAYDDKSTDNAGNLSWPNPIRSNNGYTLQINNTDVNSKFVTRYRNVDNLDNDINIVLPLAPLDRIRIDNTFYFNKFIKGETGFLDYYRWLNGEDIVPLLIQSYTLRSNARRNFFMTYNTGIAGGIGPQEPEMYGNDFYDKLPAYLNLYARYGLYLYASIFPDNGLFSQWSGNTVKQVAHWNKLKDIARQYTNFFALELTNEPDAKSYNQVDANAFSPDDVVLCCSGGRGDTGNDPMPAPQWHFCDHHTRRSYPGTVVDSCVANHPSRLYQNKPVFKGEGLGFGSEPNRESNPRIAKEIAGTLRGTAPGTIYHSTNGGFSKLYNSVEMDCAKAWFGELT